jgi:hypothetical protein
MSSAARSNSRAAGGVQAHDLVAVERWINEGGRTATDAVIEREYRAQGADMSSADVPPSPGRGRSGPRARTSPAVRGIDQSA